MMKTVPANNQRPGRPATRLQVALGLLACLPLALSAATPPDGFRALELPAVASVTDASALRQFSAAPQGRHTFNGVPFLIGAPLVVAGLEAARAGVLFPTEVMDIKVGLRARRLHLLHGTLSFDKDGVPVAKVVFHYESGATESVRLGYGVHTRDWTAPRQERTSALVDPNSQIAWPDAKEQSSAEFRLFQTALENPRPAETITGLDLVSLFSRATPFVLAASLEDADATRPANLPLPARKAVRDLKEFKDEVYRRDLVVRLTDGENSQPATNAVVSLTILEDKEVCYLGETKPDAQGVCRIAYPPQPAVGFSLWIHAPGRATVLVSETKTNVAKFAEDYAVLLKRGTTVGGVVKVQDGQGIAGAQVVISLVTKISPHHYNRVDYDAAETDAQGRWTSSSLPPDLSGFTFQVSHPEFVPGFYATAGYAPAPTNTTTSVSSSSGVTYRQLPDGTMEQVTTTRRVGASRPTVSLLTSEALLASRAELILRPAFLLQGTLADANGKPVPDAELILLRAESSTGRKYLRTDAQGGFRTHVAEAGAVGLAVLRAGAAPLYQTVIMGTKISPVTLQLAPARVVQGLVQDRGRRPIPGARVRLESWHGTSDLLRFTAFSDGAGKFTWPGAPLDQVTFSISKTNYANNRHSLAAGAETMELLLNRPPGVFGRVYDAETRKPVESFTVIPGRKYSSAEKQIRWERYEKVRGSGGEYALPIDSYMFQPEARVLIEAPGYEPQVSPPFTSSDSYTNDFALKKGRGMSGLVQLPDGTPAAGAILALVENNEYGYLDTGGRLQSNSGSTDLARADAQGRFEFAPKLEPSRIFASHEQGFGEIAAADLLKGGKIKLQQWGRVKGVVRVGDQPSPDDSVRLQKWQSSYPDQNHQPSMLSFQLKADIESDGQFLYDKVPPGEHRLALEHRFRENPNEEAPLSHGRLITVKPGETVEVTLGGNGRRVTGRVKISGGEPSDVDWKRDVHRLMLVQPGQPSPAQAQGFNGQESFISFSPLINRQAVGSIEEMRQRERADRTYVLVFETNGTFRADHIPPGKYHLRLNPTDPNDDNYSRRPIGNLGQEILVPQDAQAAVNAAFDLGELELTIRPRVRLGREVPPFEAKTAAGKTIQVSNHRGTNVLLYFWGQSVGYSTYDVQTLKQFQATHGGTNGKLIIYGLNLDSDPKQAAQFAQQQGMNWPQLYLGDWNQTSVPGMFGLNGSSGAVLIDAQGRLAAGPLRGTQMRNTVTNALE